MKVTDLEIIEQKSAWRRVRNIARATMGRRPILLQPSKKWKLRMLMSEHSPIRSLTLRWTWKGLPSWVSVHFVRHKIGVEHFVQSQRTDRTGKERGSQNDLVNHSVLLNAQALISISRKRLCMKASRETRSAWEAALKIMSSVDPEIDSVCVPDCIYRGLCPELKTCGYSETTEYKIWRSQYVKLGR